MKVGSGKTLQAEGWGPSLQCHNIDLNLVQQHPSNIEVLLLE